MKIIFNQGSRINIILNRVARENEKHHYCNASCKKCTGTLERVSRPGCTAHRCSMTRQDPVQEKNMALEIVSHFFDIYRKNGKDGENALQLVRENISNSIKRSSLGNYLL